MAKDYDIAVVGGGVLGSAIAFGLARDGQRVVVLDEGDIAKRASRGNFALVWVQSKGLGMPAYTGWTIRSTQSWPQLEAELKERTGLDVCLEQTGGFNICLSEREMEARRAMMRQIHAQEGVAKYEVALLDRSEVEKMLPGIGQDVVGGSFCPLDGHVNALRLFHAFHLANHRLGIDYRPNHRVGGIDYDSGLFRIHTSRGEIEAGKIVLAAGNANAHLAPMVGLSAPMQFNCRGQIVVTERLQRFMRYPIGTLRQTDEGTVMIGDSYEDSTDDGGMNFAINSVMLDRAQRTFPFLANVNIIRSWSCLRVMTQDGFPIYDQSETCPGAFVACCHSGVTLAAVHAYVLAPMIARGSLDAQQTQVFSAQRFHVQKAA
ncbi:FAD-binding oxidoreductase [Pseudolabrys sp. FHR47]|uniref:NAD(P)/FAD-dependent oxidoreductase n=1 Tax=Pseudolabrys sp. FHR47 TaxID=2562284 RepID=UPI0010BE787F|nr:FAD-binding oxidoreductase [Pseudolabrys sp. FHR47]